jgi:hypothetical protein
MTKQHLFVNNITELISANESYNLSLILDQLEKHPLSIAPWEAFPYKPKVAFSMAHAEGFIYLKYYVSEQQIRAVNNATNGSVWEDSCVEFFVNFEGEGYYNLECNVIGTILLCYGAGRNDREKLPAEVIEKIQFQSTIQNNKTDKTIDWTMTLAIPLSIFTHHPSLSLKGKTCHANFYKCGDKLAEPHFVTWSNIDTPKPDFHRPDFFGRVVFEG